MMYVQAIVSSSSDTIADPSQLSMKRHTSHLSEDESKRLRRSMVASSSCPKAGIAQILLKLHQEGLLADGFIDNANEDAVRKSLGKAVGELAAARTPYGPLVQEMELDTTPPARWPFIHPLALVFHLSASSAAFSRLMSSCLEKVAGGLLKIVIFVDEHRPGNVLRPDAGRATQGVYWCFSDWPEWLLCRANAWLTFGVIRTTMIEKCRGFMSEFMKNIVHVFFHPVNTSFASTGGLLHRPGGDIVILKASLGGLLGDEKGMKEVFASKGPSSTRPCLSCKNIVKFLDDAVSEDSYLQSIDCADPVKFDLATDADVYEAADIVRAASRTTKKALEAAELATGIHWNQTGIMFDPACRAIVRPCTGWLRDWMHMLCVAGVANTEVMQVCKALRVNGVMWSMLTDFFSVWHLPKSIGTVHPEWFTGKRLGHREEKDSFRGFASELLTIVPILRVFLDMAIAPMGIMGQEIASFRSLADLMQLLSLGADKAARHVDQIERTIRDHAASFKAAYPNCIKPKWHHLFHVVDHIKSTGRLLNCFVTERKHRAAKAIANHTFRHYETTLTNDILNQMHEDFTDDAESLFIPEYLVSGQLLSLGDRYDGNITRSCSAVLLSGHVYRGDVIMTSDRTVGQIRYFLATKLNNDEFQIVCIMSPMRRRDDGKYYPPSGSVAVVSGDILAAVKWSEDATGILVIPPPISVTWH